MRFDEKECPYAVLGISRDADFDAVRAAYRERSKLLHPDKHESGTPEQDAAAKQFVKVKAAYEELEAVFTPLGQLKVALQKLGFNIDDSYFNDYPTKCGSARCGTCLTELKTAWSKKHGQQPDERDLFLLCWLDSSKTHCLNGAAVYDTANSPAERKWIHDLDLCDLGAVALIEAAQEFRNKGIDEGTFRSQASFVYEEVFNGGQFKAYSEMITVLCKAKTRLERDSAEDSLKSEKIKQLGEVITELLSDLKTEVQTMISSHLAELKAERAPGADFAKNKVDNIFNKTAGKLRVVAQSEKIKGRRNLIKDFLRGALGVLLSFMALFKSGRRVWNAAFFKPHTEAKIDQARHRLENRLRR